MTARDGASSVQGIVMRITPLKIDGTIDSAKPIHWTRGFISLSFSPEITAGDEIETKGADGAVCVSWKADDSLKRININLSLCNVDPEALVLLTGGKVLTEADGTTVTGYTAAPVGTAVGNPVAIEVWSYRNVGGKPGNKPYWHWVFPYVKVRYEGEREFGNAALANAFTGQGLGNPALCAAGGLYGGTTPAPPAIKSRATGNPNEVFSYSEDAYAAALNNPFSYVEAGDANIPAFTAADGVTICPDCAGSWTSTAWGTQVVLERGADCTGVPAP